MMVRLEDTEGWLATNMHVIEVYYSVQYVTGSAPIGMLETSHECLV